jgi:molecular chaperone HtpG
MMSFYGEMPDSMNIVVNGNHPLVTKLVTNMEEATKGSLQSVYGDIETAEARKNELNKAKEGKKDEEISQADKDALSDVEKQLEGLKDQKKEILASFANNEELVSQLIDLALLSNNMLKGENLTKFIKRSVSLM